MNKDNIMYEEDLKRSIQCFSVSILCFLFALLLGPIENHISLYSRMNQNNFALGISKRESKREKRERLRRETIWKSKEKKRKHFKILTKNYTTWRILPYETCRGLAFWMDTLQGKSFFEKRQSLLKQINRLGEPNYCPFRFPPSDNRVHMDFLEKTKDMENLLQQNQDLRWRFKFFLNKIRITKMKKANDVDPFTLEAYKQPIQTCHFPTRVLYTFEAESFMKHVTKRLLNNDGHIALPLFPKNPLTNENFTLAQTISLLQQCRQYGHSSWPIEAFSSCQYNLNIFLAIHSKPLRLHALHTTMSKVDDWEFIDTLYDFIKSQHVQHQKICQHLVYKWAILHCPQHQCIKKWRRICVKWYEIDILMDDSDVRDIEYQKLEKITLSLCDVPTDLLEEKNRAYGSRSP